MDNAGLNPQHNRTEISSISNGPVHTGSGNINIIIADLKAAIQLLKDNAPKEQIEAVDMILKVLQEIAYYQKKVNELKTVHNMLHDLETILSIYRRQVWYSEVNSDYNYTFFEIKSAWKTVVRGHISRIEAFAENDMVVLKPEFVTYAGKGWEGPSWIVNLVAWRQGFEATLDRNDHEEACNLWVDVIGICHDELVRIDKQLLEAANQLDRLTERVLKTISGEPDEH